MALFQKKEITNIAPLYTSGLGRTRLIIGLGNVGKAYGGTRHNVGFAVVDEFVKSNQLPDWLVRKDLKAQVSIGQIGPDRVIVAKPTTLMNSSGQAARALQHFYKVANQDTLVVYDELAIPFGQLRMRIGGSDAGHNGVKSLIAEIGEDFGRLRVGIGGAQAADKEAADFVLAKFSRAEQTQLPLIAREASALINEFIVSDHLQSESRTII